MSTIQTAAEKKYIRKVTASSFIGNTLEYYERLRSGSLPGPWAACSLDAAAIRWAASPR